MIVNLKNIKYYFLTCNNPKRKAHMIEEFKDYNLTEINPVNDVKFKSASTGFSRILDLAIRNQDRNKPFQPFIMFEDDAKKYRDFPETIELPDDADILYIGLSRAGFNGIKHGKLCYINYNDNLVRVYNMLSGHGIMICSLSGLLALQKCMVESYYLNIHSDFLPAQIQPYYNVYALKRPLVYQYKAMGGQENATKIELGNNNIPMVPEWINKTNFSIITYMGTNKY